MGDDDDVNENVFRLERRMEDTLSEGDGKGALLLDALDAWTYDEDQHETGAREESAQRLAHAAFVAGSLLSEDAPVEELNEPLLDLAGLALRVLYELQYDRRMN